MRMRLVLAIACASIISVVAAGAAQADPLNDGSITLTFFNCSGPAGTPPTFTATKMPNGGSGFHLVDSTGVFRRTSVTDPVAGVTITYGLQNNDRPLVTCNVVSQLTGHVLVVSGFFVPVGNS